MKIMILYTFIFLLLLTQGVFSDPKPKDTIKWSPYQGKKTWQEAKEQCLSINMRLPTIFELTVADEAGTSKGWQKNGSRFWAVNKVLGADETGSRAIYLLGETKEENHKPFSQLGVFCANVTEESTSLDKIRELEENNGSASEIQELKFKFYSKKFSEYQGEMKWSDANKKCKSLKMRLPTVDELKKAHESGYMKSWQPDGSSYWSDSPYEAGKYYFIVVNSGGVDYSDDRNDSSSVRCIR